VPRPKLVPQAWHPPAGGSGGRRRSCCFVFCKRVRCIPPPPGPQRGGRRHAAREVARSTGGQLSSAYVRTSNQGTHRWAAQGDLPDQPLSSKNEYRLKELKQVLRPEANWRAETERWEEELRQFLRQNLLGSTAYLLLVTEQSIKKNSAWIQFEIDIAFERAKEVRPHGGFFAPCVAEGATLSDLPAKANRFQGIDLGSHDGVSNLITALNFDFEWLAQHTRYLQRASEWGKGGRRPNRLLSGDEIAQAKAWVARRPKSAPEPTALHLDFIRASEEEAEARSSRAFLLYQSSH
jgi:hypothetical protein